MQTAAAIACVVVPIYLIPLFFQFTRNNSALEAGVQTLPFIGATVTGALPNGAIFEKLSFYMAWFSTGGMLITIGGPLFLTTNIDTSNTQIYGYSVVGGLGAGLSAQLGFTVAQAKVGPELVPLATTFVSCGQMAGVTLSLGTATSIFLNQAASKISLIIPNASLSDVQASIAGADASFVQTLSPLQRLQVLNAVTSTIAHVFSMVVAGGVLAILLSIFTRREWLFPQTQSIDAANDQIEIDDTRSVKTQ